MNDQNRTDAATLGRGTVAPASPQPEGLYARAQAAPKRPSGFLGLGPIGTALLLGGLGLTSFLASRRGGTGEPLDPPRLRGIAPIGARLQTPESPMSPLLVEMMQDIERRTLGRKRSLGQGTNDEP